MQRVRGFTLLEMVIALSVLSVITLAGFQIIGSGLEAFDATRNRLETTGKAGNVLPRLTGELREMAYSSGAYSVTTMNANNLVFAKGDGTTVTIGQAGSAITLAYDSLNGGAAYTLVDGVTAFTLVYYQSDGITAATSGTDLAFVQIAFTVSHDVTDYARRTRVAMRN